MGISFDRVAGSYDQTRGGPERAALYAEALLPWLSSPCLEVGVGTGIVAAELRRRGLEVIGVDLAASMLALAAPRLSGRLVRGSAAALPFADATFASVALVWVMHVVDDQEAVLADVARVLPPGGRLVLAATRQSPGDELSAVSEGVGRTLRPQRYGRDQPEQLTRMAGAAGFVAVHHGSIDHDYATSPSRIAVWLEERRWSLLWDVTEAEWASHVVPAIAELRARPDIEVRRVAEQPLLVFEKR